MEMDLDEKFDRMVNLIRSLPKDGTLKIENDKKLKIYSLYKQATEGPCTNEDKPSFYDIVGKAKW